MHYEFAFVSVLNSELYLCSVVSYTHACEFGVNGVQQLRLEFAVCATTCKQFVGDDALRIRCISVLNNSKHSKQSPPFLTRIIH